MDITLTKPFGKLVLNSYYLPFFSLRFHKRIYIVSSKCCINWFSPIIKLTLEFFYNFGARPNTFFLHCVIFLFSGFLYNHLLKYLGDVVPNEPVYTPVEPWRCSRLTRWP